MTTPSALYRIADALELTLELTTGPAPNKVRGERQRWLELAGVPLPGDIRVVSSVTFGNAASQTAALLLQAPGRLGLLASYREPEGLALQLLDLDRLALEPDGLLELNCPTDLAAVDALLAPAVVAGFTFSDGTWLPQPGPNGPQQVPSDQTSQATSP